MESIVMDRELEDTGLPGMEQVSQPLKAADLNEIFRQYRMEADPAKKDTYLNQIILHNQRLVTSVAKRYINMLPYTSLEFRDLMQDGNMGLIRALQDYDPDLGYAFSTYACHWIREFIGRSISNNANTIRIPVHMIEKIRKVKNAENAFKEKFGHFPSEKELSEFTGILESEIGNIQYSATLTNLVSLSAQPRSCEDGDTELEDFIDARDEGHERILEEMSKKEIEVRIRRLLNEKEYDIVCRRLAYGDYDHCWTLQEIGDVYGVSRERIRQIEALALKKIRRKLNYVLG